MVTITNNSRLSHVFRTTNGVRSVPGGKTDTFDLADPGDPQFARLKASGAISVNSPLPAAAPTPTATIQAPKPAAESGAAKS